MVANSVSHLWFDIDLETDNYVWEAIFQTNLIKLEVVDSQTLCVAWWQTSLLDIMKHYSGVIMDATPSQIASVSIVYSIVWSGAYKKTPKLPVTGLCGGNWPVTGEFPAQMASNAENVDCSRPMSASKLGCGADYGKCFHLMTSSYKCKCCWWCF